jgi:hypothetical protein
VQEGFPQFGIPVVALFGQASEVDTPFLHDLYQGVDPGLYVKEFIDNDYIFAGNYTISGMEIPFFISDRDL